MISITSILLAAGLSRRFGKDNKLLADIDGVPMVRRTAQNLCNSKADRVIVVLGHEAQRVGAALNGLALETVLNDDYHNGQASSVRAGLRATRDDATGIMICLSDQPLLKAADYDALMDVFLEHPSKIVVPLHEGKRANPVVLPGALQQEILKGDIKFACRSFIERNLNLVHLVEMNNPAYRADFDTPEAISALGTFPKDDVATTA